MGYQDKFNENFQSKDVNDENGLEFFDIGEPQFQRMQRGDLNYTPPADTPIIEFAEMKGGNRMWLEVDFSGRKAERVFSSPEELIKAIRTYLKWCDENPIMIKDVYGKNNQIIAVEKFNAPTLRGFLGANGIDRGTFVSYKRTPQYAKIIDIFQSVMYGINVSAAVAGAANPRIVGAIHGIVDKKEVTTTEKQSVTLYVPSAETTNIAQAGDVEDAEEIQDFEVD